MVAATVGAALVLGLLLRGDVLKVRCHKRMITLLWEHEEGYDLHELAFLKKTFLLRCLFFDSNKNRNREIEIEMNLIHVVPRGCEQPSVDPSECLEQYVEIGQRTSVHAVLHVIAADAGVHRFGSNNNLDLVERDLDARVVRLDVISNSVYCASLPLESVTSGQRISIDDGSIVGPH